MIEELGYVIDEPLLEWGVGRGNKSWFLPSSKLPGKLQRSVEARVAVRSIYLLPFHGSFGSDLVPVPGYVCGFAVKMHLHRVAFMLCLLGTDPGAD